MALTIGLILGIPSGFALGELFSDVDSSAWYASAVESLTEKRIIAGYPDGTYGPSNYVNRAELAVVLDRILDYMEDGVVVLEGDYVLDEALLEERITRSPYKQLYEDSLESPEEWVRLTVNLDIGEPTFEKTQINYDLPASVDQELRVTEVKKEFLNDLANYDLRNVLDYMHFSDLSFEIQNKNLAQIFGHPKLYFLRDSLTAEDYNRVVSFYGEQIVNIHPDHEEILFKAIEDPDGWTELDVYFNFPFNPDLRRMDTDEANVQ